MRAIDEVLFVRIRRRFLCAEPESEAERDHEDEEGKSFHRGAETMVLAPVQERESIFPMLLVLICRGLVVKWVFAVFPFDRDAEGAEKVYVILGERGAVLGTLSGFSVLAFLHFVQANGGLEHQQDVKPVLANILHDTGDLLTFDDGLMNGFTELLDQFAQARCHDFLRQLPAWGMRRAAVI
jgi:hypothetical protein